MSWDGLGLKGPTEERTYDVKQVNGGKWMEKPGPSTQGYSAGGTDQPFLEHRTMTIDES